MKLNFMGQFYGCVGIANHARSFANALSYKIDDLRLAPIFQNQNNDQYGLNENLNTRFKTLDPEAPTLAYWYPDTFQKLFEQVPNAKKKIGYYIFEYNKIPAGYIDAMNKLDAVCTPSSWGKKVLEDNGLTVPAFSVPGGVDGNIFNSKNRKLDDRKFKFLHIGKTEERKNTAKLIRAFARAFSNDKNVRMTLFIHNIHIPKFDSSSYVYKVLADAGLEQHFLKFDIKNFVEDLVSVYNTHHVAIFPSSSEGIGLPTLEAMSCGVPVITTLNTAMLDYANENNSILITDLKEEQVWDPHFFPTKGSFGTWMTPSEEDLMNKMKWTYENYEKAAIIGNTAEEWVSKNYNWDLAADKFLEIL
jgi:glycosyltransferase involved in cell wall biosynthesis